MFERLCELALAPVDPESAPETHESRDSPSESEHPHEITTTTPHALANLLHAVKAGGLRH
ncbi:hypothetical protein [Streptomyces albicerus]|uniref:hypothetical protein n=1 Tax=Streptomyces albicerus TaxID=2569859 RepID=UPI00124B2DFD|nr:hypothetical protein [Streptomyces albicerus]